MANANVKPFNVERFLVAFDFVSFYIKKAKPDLTTIFQDPSISNKAKVRRKIEHIAVSENMQNLLEYLDESESELVRKDFEEFYHNKLTSKDLTDFSRKYYDDYIEEGICIRNFSKYCAKIAAMATCFYECGVMDAPDFAVELIVSSFPDDPNLNWTYLDFANEMNVNTQEKSKTEESSNDSISTCNPERFLVAVDFVSYFMKKIKPDLTTVFQDPRIFNKAKIRRKTAHIAVSEDMQDFFKYLDEKVSDLVRKDFEVLVNNNLSSKDSLTDFSLKYYDAYIEEGIGIRNFSKYCAKISAMASCFYDNGMMDAPDLAVQLIISSFPDDPNLNWAYLDFANEKNKSSGKISEKVDR